MKIKTNIFTQLLILSILFIYGCDASSQNKTEILWDKFGVPHIYAHKYDQLFYSFGWAQMKNHANLMLRLFAQSRGRASEYYGDQYIDSDKWVYTHNIPQRAKEWLDLQKPSFKLYFESFVNGINDYAKNYPNDIDIENQAVLPIRSEDLLTHYQRVIMYHFVTNPREVQFDPKSINSNKGSNAWAIGPSK
ncbi:MAG: penicillin acylase family protein [Candidatus Marinimicrobia bacterium]|nr:penicillin acylase family protein [Candidatus Neomarinimicrobiota bacterium]